MEEGAQSRDMGKRAKFAFGTIISLYTLVFAGLVFYAGYTGKSGFATGLFIGMIYPLVAFYYFYSGYFIPFRRERRRVRVEGKGIVLLLIQWMFPIIVIQTFTCLAFWLTIEHAPFTKTMYTNPYQYGLMYKQLEEMRRDKKTASDDIERFLTRADHFFEARTPSEDASKQAPAGNTSDDNKKDPKEPDLQETEILIFTIPFYIAVTFGFLGSLIYTLRDIGYRFYTEDLQPRTFVNYIIRFVFAAVICIVIAFFLMNDWWVNAAPLIFFFVGYFPDRGMQYLEETALKRLGVKKEDRLDMPLSLIQGTNDYLIYRFKEIGIHDIQNLAYVDLNELRTNIGYSANLLCDFVAQALLFIHLKDHFTALQAFGIRNIVHFRRIITRENCEPMADAMGIPARKLLNMLEVLETEPMKTRLDDLETCHMQKFQAEG